MHYALLQLLQFLIEFLQHYIQCQGKLVMQTLLQVREGFEWCVGDGHVGEGSQLVSQVSH